MKYLFSKLLLITIITALFSQSCSLSDNDEVKNDTISLKGGVFMDSNKYFIKLFVIDTIVSFPINDKTNSLSSIYNTVNPLSYNKESILVEVRGVFDTTSTPSFDVYYVDRAETKNAQNAPIPYCFWAWDHTPSWSLEINKLEGFIAFKNYQYGYTAVYDYSEPTVDKYGNFKYTIKEYQEKEIRVKERVPEIKYSKKKKIKTYKTVYTKSKQIKEKVVMTIYIRKEECENTVSLSNLNYSCELTFLDKEFNGCAIK